MKHLSFREELHAIEAVIAFAEKTTATVRDTTHKRTAATEEMAQAARQGYFATAEAVRNLNTKLIEIAQANTMAAINFAREVYDRKEPY
jgi:hypothetical protein